MVLISICEYHRATNVSSPPRFYTGTLVAGESNTEVLCDLPGGSYDFVVSDGLEPSEVSWLLKTDDGKQLGGGGAPTDTSRGAKDTRRVDSDLLGGGGGSAAAAAGVSPSGARSANVRA